MKRRSEGRRYRTPHPRLHFLDGPLSHPRAGRRNVAGSPDSGAWGDATCPGWVARWRRGPELPSSRMRGAEGVASCANSLRSTGPSANNKVAGCAPLGRRFVPTDPWAWGIRCGASAVWGGIVRSDRSRWGRFGNPETLSVMCVDQRDRRREAEVFPHRIVRYLCPRILPRPTG